MREIACKPIHRLSVLPCEKGGFKLNTIIYFGAFHDVGRPSFVSKDELNRKMRHFLPLRGMNNTKTIEVCAPLRND